MTRSYGSANSSRNTGRAGVYNVKQDGLEFQHLQEVSTPTNGDAYLEQFQYVC
jgi:hypothetical protein